MRTYLADLPADVGGFVCENEDGEYTIVLNASHSRERNMKTMLHELEHIKKGDFGEAAVGEIENIRHGRHVNLERKD